MELSNEEMLTKLYLAACEMREAQKQYFGTRYSIHLDKAKAAESKFDRMRARYIELRAGTQTLLLK